MITRMSAGGGFRREHSRDFRPSLTRPATEAGTGGVPRLPGRVHRDNPRDVRLLTQKEKPGESRPAPLGILIGENRERRAAWRREHPEVFFYER